MVVALRHARASAVRFVRRLDTALDPEHERSPAVRLVVAGEPFEGSPAPSWVRFVRDDKKLAREVAAAFREVEPNADQRGVQLVVVASHGLGTNDELAQALQLLTRLEQELADLRARVAVRWEASDPLVVVASKTWPSAHAAWRNAAEPFASVASDRLFRPPQAIACVRDGASRALGTDEHEAEVALALDVLVTDVAALDAERARNVRPDAAGDQKDDMHRWALAEIACDDPAALAQWQALHQRLGAILETDARESGKSEAMPSTELVESWLGRDTGRGAVAQQWDAARRALEELAGDQGERVARDQAAEAIARASWPRDVRERLDGDLASGFRSPGAGGAARAKGIGRELALDELPKRDRESLDGLHDRLGRCGVRSLVAHLRELKGHFQRLRERLVEDAAEMARPAASIDERLARERQRFLDDIGPEPPPFSLRLLALWAAVWLLSIPSFHETAARYSPPTAPSGTVDRAIQEFLVFALEGEGALATALLGAALCTGASLAWLRYRWNSLLTAFQRDLTETLRAYAVASSFTRNERRDLDRSLRDALMVSTNEALGELERRVRGVSRTQRAIEWVFARVAGKLPVVTAKQEWHAVGVEDIAKVAWRIGAPDHVIAIEPLPARGWPESLAFRPHEGEKAERLFLWPDTVATTLGEAPVGAAAGASKEAARAIMNALELGGPRIAFDKHAPNELRMGYAFGNVERFPDLAKVLLPKSEVESHVERGGWGPRRDRVIALLVVEQAEMLRLEERP